MDVRHDLRVGTELAGYRLEAVLGRGGMGVVYLAEDSRLKRKVALKLLSRELADDEDFRARFFRESELAASLDHPNIVPIYEAGEADGRVFIAMRYVEGGDLKDRLRAAPLEAAAAIDILDQVAGALDAAHRQGLVHRDVKPSNILIDPGMGRQGGDHAYLADFGLTRHFNEPGATDDGQLMGTIDYVSPEQIAGGEIDGRADEYSLGCLLYECLTGEPPFLRDSDVAVLYAHLEDDPPSVVERRAELPQEVDTVLARALAKAPEERYDSCLDLVDAARNALGLARPKRSRRRLAAVLVVIGLLLIGAGVASYFALSGGEAKPRHDTLVRIDPAKNTVANSYSVGPQATSVATGDGYVWATSFEDRTLWRVDPETGAARVTKIQGGTPLDVVERNGLAVIANGPLEVSFERIDAASGATLETIPLLGAELAPTAIAAGPYGIWGAACGYDGGSSGRVSEAGTSAGVQTSLERIGIVPPDPNWLFYITPDAGGFNDVAVGEGAVWLVRDGGAILKRIDPETKEIVATVALPFVAKSITVGAGAVWLTAVFDDVVARLDPKTNAITMTVPVGAGSDGVAVGDGSVWVASSIAGEVTRIDPATGEILATIEVGGRPDHIAAGEGGVWVTTHAT